MPDATTPTTDAQTQQTAPATTAQAGDDAADHAAQPDGATPAAAATHTTIAQALDSIPDRYTARIAHVLVEKKDLRRVLLLARECLLAMGLDKQAKEVSAEDVRNWRNLEIFSCREARKRKRNVREILDVLRLPVCPTDRSSSAWAWQDPEEKMP